MLLVHSGSSRKVSTTVGIDCSNYCPTKLCNLNSREGIAAIVRILGILLQGKIIIVLGKPKIINVILEKHNKAFIGKSCKLHESCKLGKSCRSFLGTSYTP